VTTPVLELEGVGVRFGNANVLAGVDLTLAAGELLAVLGPSGSGKTTMLHAIAGFVPLAAGSITIDGRTVAGGSSSAAPEDRNVGVVFQHHALWPHLTAAETIAFPLRRRRSPEPERAGEVARLLDRLGISHLAERRPDELSGGEQQRVSLARALARHPSLFLFDEPTAHLDAALRRALLDEINDQRLLESTGAMYATHDAAEALAIADRVLLLRSGRVVQLGDPVEVYEQPVDRWAAELTGPSSVLKAGVVRTGNGRARISVGAAERDVDCSGEEVGVPLIRPEWAGLGGPFSAVVERVWYRGSRTEYRVDTGAGRLILSEIGPPRVGAGETVGWDLTRVHLLAAEPLSRR
jgi:ABC-type Fe3+/spermidine/putrescine transport system ATPase subunit